MISTCVPIPMQRFATRATRRWLRNCQLIITRAAQDGSSQNQDNRARQQQAFDQNIEQIRSGAHLGWLQHLALIYFAIYRDTDRSLSPRDRIVEWLGEERVDAALEALAAALSRNDLPSFNDVMKLTTNHQHYDWWYALVAGLNERWAAGPGLANLSEDFLKGMLMFDIANPVSTREGNKEQWVIHPWRKALMERQPELVRGCSLPSRSCAFPQRTNRRRLARASGASCH